MNICNADWLSVPVFTFAVSSGTTLDTTGCNIVRYSNTHTGIGSFVAFVNCGASIYDTCFASYAIDGLINARGVLNVAVYGDITFKVGIGTGNRTGGSHMAEPVLCGAFTSNGVGGAVCVIGDTGRNVSTSSSMVGVGVCCDFDSPLQIQRRVRARVTQYFALLSLYFRGPAD